MLRRGRLMSLYRPQNRENLSLCRPSSRFSLSTPRPMPRGLRLHYIVAPGGLIKDKSSPMRGRKWSLPP